MSLLTIVSVNIGPVRSWGPYRDKGDILSAISKLPILGRESVNLTPLGIEGDHRGDRRAAADGQPFHGGSRKAVSAYPISSYMWWRMARSLDVMAGSFGENLTVAGGQTEADMVIGDRWRWGNAILEVTGPRPPGFKLNVRWGEGVAEAMIENGRCGWFFSVIQPAVVPVLATMHLIHRPTNSITVLEAFRELVRRYPGVHD